MPIASTALIVLLRKHALTLQTTEADHYCGFGSCLVCFNVYEITRDENCRDLASRWHVSLTHQRLHVGQSPVSHGCQKLQV